LVMETFEDRKVKHIAMFNWTLWGSFHKNSDSLVNFKLVLFNGVHMCYL
jgi:hypothetical protein